MSKLRGKFSEKKNIIPQKKLGQNFLKNNFVINQILSIIDIRDGDFVFEIGPGMGALSIPITNFFENKIKYTAVEIDSILVNFLKKKLKKKSVEVINNDFLLFNFSEYFSSIKEEKKIRLIGNLPYNISSPILFKLLNDRRFIKDQHLLLQEEVVDRIIASPKNSNYGRISVMLQAYYYTEKVLNIDPNCFFPAPKVNSSLIKMIPRRDQKNEIIDFNSLSYVVKKAFSAKRKMIKNTLGEIFSEIEFNHLKIKSSCRPEEISVKSFVELSKLFLSKEL